MMKKENNKGITLIALVITIIVMLILVAVTINVATDGGLIKKAKMASDQTKRAAELEELEIENAVKAADGEDFIVEIEDKFGNKYKYYRLDKVTDEQREKCRANGIPMLMGDVNFDSKLTNEDIILILSYVDGSSNPNEYQKILGDINNDNDLSATDISECQPIVNEKLSLRKVAIIKELGFKIEIEMYKHLEKLVEDEETGKIYYIEEKVTEEEVKKLEKYGVAKIQLGDLDLDGKLTQEDLNILSNAIEKKTMGKTLDLTNIQTMLADMSENGVISPEDLTLLSNKLN